MVGLLYYSFRIMIAIGFFLAGLMSITLIQWLRGAPYNGDGSERKMDGGPDQDPTHG